MTDSPFARRLKPWGLTFRCEHPEIPLEGSPERTLNRFVLEDDRDRLFILERIDGALLKKKIAIARRLALLRESGLETINPYLPVQSNYLVPIDNDYWQVQPYLKSVKLDRETYADQAWRGQAMAGFLADLRRASESFPAEAPFSLPVYGRRIGRQLEEQHPGSWTELRDVWEYLEAGLFKKYDTLTCCFSHGDFHPLNILWTENGIRAVIDWEFCGFKPELYDAALMTGCVGFDMPEYLTQSLLTTFLKDLRRHDLATPESWASFVDLVLAIRIGWLREWLVRKDKTALEQEVVYMQLLRDNVGLLQNRWGIG
jgi:homoserine kinase type II